MERYDEAVTTREDRDLATGDEDLSTATATGEEQLTTRDLASQSQPRAARDEERPRSEVDRTTAEPLLPAEVTGSLQRQWEEVQTRFVDEPRGAVQEADKLVASVMQQLAEGFAQERERLEAQWGRGEDISTEDLRVALQRYRSFFQRLLST
jgi:hypothetical protein